MRVDDGRNRVVIEHVTPQVDGGAWPIKRVIGEQVLVEADAFADGHDAITVLLRYRDAGDADWHELEMEPLGNDRWRGAFRVATIGRGCYTVAAYVDHFKSWARDMAKRIEAAQVALVDLEIGALLLDAAQVQASGAEAAQLGRYAATLRAGTHAAALDPTLAAVMAHYAPRPFVTTTHELPITVDRERARFSAWYELFPRSTATEPGRHGTFKDVEARLPYVAGLGFDILYLTPIHPIGQTFRKGKDNSPTAALGEPGSPYAIGNADGGHKSIHPELGTLVDFRSLVQAARAAGMEIALDNAFQSSPDHPYVREHPEWFRARPDGTIQYAENPPKKYQDIYPFDFETERWPELWQELKSYFDFWIEQGVLVFRVDNPHTKAFPFWEWCIAKVTEQHPEVIFLAEAFTRPKIMYRLAKLGFTQSYTYFTWRTTKAELTEYMTELTQTELREFFRPNFWPNTHDILTPQFYGGQRGMFIARFVLAATLTASYGIYGPPFELMLHTPAAGREEYSDNEKYELRHWEDQSQSLAGLITQVNALRRAHVALQSNERLRFHDVDNDQLIAYTKSSADHRDIILTIVNLDPENTQSGMLYLPIHEFGLPSDQLYSAHDLLTGARYTWQPGRNYVALDPQTLPAHILQIEVVRTDEQIDSNP